MVARALLLAVLLGAGDARGPSRQQDGVAKTLAAEEPVTLEEFSLRWERIHEPGFLHRPAAEQIPVFRSIVAAADHVAPADRAEVGERAAYAVRGLAVALFREREVTEGLRLLRAGRTRWAPHTHPTRLAGLYVAEANMLMRIGVLDRAQSLYARAIELVDGAPREGEYDVGGYFNAHFNSIRFKMAAGRFQGAFDEVDRWEIEIDWDWYASKISPARIEADAACILGLRGGAAVFLGEAGQREAEELLNEMLAMEGVRVADRVTAYSYLMRLHVDRGELEEARAVLRAFDREGIDLARLEEETRRQGGFDPGSYQLLNIAGLRTIVCDAADREEALADLHASMERFLETRREAHLPVGTASSRFDQFRLAQETLVRLAPTDELIELVSNLQTVGQLWTSLGRPRPTVAEIRDALTSEDTGLLVFVPGYWNDRWIALEPTGDPHVYVVPPEQAREELVRSFQALLQSPPHAEPPTLRASRPERLERLSSQISGLLFPPELSDRLAGWKRVFVVGREDLEDLSFEALPLLDGVPFGCSHAVVDLPSIPVGVALARAADAESTPGKTVKLVADPLISQAVARDYGLEPELGLTDETLLRSLGIDADDPEPMCFLHGNAAAHAIGRSPSRQVGLLHVIAHGIRDPYRELEPMLALTPDAMRPDGLLGVKDVRRLSCPPIVFLSSCSTGGSPPRSGDAGSNHLGGAFIEAGATTVLLSPGEVLLDATLELGRLFYAEWRGGSPPAEAMRSARARLRQQPPYSDPYHWGLMRVFGLGR